MFFALLALSFHKIGGILANRANKFAVLHSICTIFALRNKQNKNMSILKQNCPVALCSDHAGYDTKEAVKAYLESEGIAYKR